MFVFFLCKILVKKLKEKLQIGGTEEEREQGERDREFVEEGGKGGVGGLGRSCLKVLAFLDQVAVEWSLVDGVRKRFFLFGVVHGQVCRMNNLFFMGKVRCAQGNANAG